MVNFTAAGVRAARSRVRRSARTAAVGAPVTTETFYMKKELNYNFLGMNLTTQHVLY